MRKATLIAGTLSVAVVAALLAYQRVQQDGEVQKMWTVEGDVSVGSEPSAEATIWPRGAESLSAVKTDDNGHYILKGTIPGNYALYATKEKSGTSQIRSVNVLAGSRTSGIDFRLDNSIAISGNVFDSEGAPLVGVNVTALVKSFRNGVLRFEQKGHTGTNNSGGYRIADLAKGQYYLLASRALASGAPKPRKRPPPSAPDAERPFVVATMLNSFHVNSDSVDGATPVRVSTGEQRSGVDIILNKVNTFCVYATVAEVPGAGAHQSAAFQIYQMMGESFPTIASGKVILGEEIELCGIPPGFYKVVATTGNQDPVTDVQNYKTTGFTETEFVVSKREVDLKTLFPRPGIPIGGIVKLDGRRDDQPLPTGLSVILDQQARPIYAGEDRLRRPNDIGEFLFESVLVDDYRLRVTGLPNGHYIREATQNGRDALRESVSPGRGDIRIVIAPDGPTVGGQTVDAENQPVSDAIVILMSDDQKFAVTQQSDQKGQFQFSSGVAPGKYRLLALTGVFEGEEQSPDVVGANLRYAADLDLSPQTTKTINILVHRVR